MSAVQSPKYWAGDPPSKCDLCSHPITKVFVDGKTRLGPWGNLCPSCHTGYGAGLGTGRGQRYERTASGEWVKTAG